jgi:hypothetical protein
MSSKLHRAPSPTSPALPGLPSVEFWNDTQWTVFMSLVDAVLPSIVTEATLTDKAHQVQISDADYSAAYEQLKRSMANAPSEKDFRSYLQFCPSKDPVFIKNYKRSLATLPSDIQKKLAGSLSLLA